MPRQGSGSTPPDRRYEDTHDPARPPEVFEREQTRQVTLMTVLGTLGVLFIAIAFVIMAGRRERVIDPDSAHIEREEVGTAGERRAEDRQPGGFDPAPHFRTPEAEQKYRGAGIPPQGPTGGLSQDQVFTSLGSVVRHDQAAAGGRVELHGVQVELVNDGTFVVREGDARATVVAPQGDSVARQGARVDLAGIVERDASGGVRIRAERVNVR